MLDRSVDDGSGAGLRSFTPRYSVGIIKTSLWAKRSGLLNSHSSTDQMPERYSRRCLKRLRPEFRRTGRFTSQLMILRRLLRKSLILVEL